MENQAPARPRPLRRWLRLSVRALMLAVLILGAGQGWVVHQARVQRDAVAAIKRGGGDVRYDWQLKRVRDELGDFLPPNPKGVIKGPWWLVGLLGPDYFATVKAVYIGPRNGDAVMAHVGRLDEVEAISIGAGMTLSDAGTRHLAGMRKLRSLRFLSGLNYPKGTGVTGAGIRPLAGLTTLQQLNLAPVPLGKDDIASLRGMSDLRSLDLETAADADLTAIAHLRALRSLALRGPGLTDDNLAHLKGLTRLERLTLSGGRLTSAGLVHLRELRKLQRLAILRNGVDDLTPIRDLTELTSLIVTGDPIDDRSLAALAGLPRLRVIRLRNTKITGTGLSHLRELPGLVTLDLSGTRVTDEALREMRSLMRLMYLDLIDTQVTDAGIRFLVGHPSLKQVRLANTRITDAGLRHLAGIKSLTILDVKGTRVTSAGVAELQKALPRLKLIR